MDSIPEAITADNYIRIPDCEPIRLDDPRIEELCKGANHWHQKYKGRDTAGCEVFLRNYSWRNHDPPISHMICQHLARDVALRDRVYLAYEKRMVEGMADIEGTEEKAQDAPGLNMLSFEGLLNLQEPGWLVPGVLPESSYACLYGPSGTGKSFVALSLSLSLAAGTPWLADEPALDPGAVCYLAGEGGFGLRKRVEAWLIGALKDDAENTREHRLKETFWLQNGAVNFFDRDAVRGLMQVLRGLEPRLLVVDTLATAFSGADENSARDMGTFNTTCQRIIQATGATVLVVHHTGKQGDDERGSSALRGACDTMVRCKRGTPARTPEGDRVVVLENTKMKDSEEFAEKVFHLVPSLEVDSAFLRPVGGVDARAERMRRMDALLELIDRCDQGSGVASGELRKVWERFTRTTSKTTFNSYIKRARRDGYVLHEGVGKAHFYSLSKRGRDYVRSVRPVVPIE